MKLAGEILNAMKAYENSKPRNKQVRLGPSELGGCREYIRNVMVGTPMQDNDEWPTAAVVGTLAGTYMETVCEQYMGALTEVPVTTTLPSGLQVSGHADIVLPDRNAVVDCKSKDGLDETLRNGSSLENLIQISVYATGLVQAGILDRGCTAHLVYLDRSGNQQFLHERVLTYEEIEFYVEKCEERLNDVIVVQEAIDEGNVEMARGLRDKTPSFCYSPKVMCPFRDACWKGPNSDWYPDTILDEETSFVVEDYDRVRAELKAGDSVKKALREKLTGVSGVTPSGLAVNWAGSEERPMLYVTRVNKGVVDGDK